MFFRALDIIGAFTPFTHLQPTLNSFIACDILAKRSSGQSLGPDTNCSPSSSAAFILLSDLALCEMTSIVVRSKRTTSVAEQRSASRERYVDKAATCGFKVDTMSDHAFERDDCQNPAQ